MQKIDLKTRDGLCPSYVFRPDGTGPWPAVLCFMDGIGIRPALFEIGERLAKSGYFVLLPDLFYRAGAYEPMKPAEIFSDPAKRQMLVEKFFSVATQANIMSDTQAFLDWLGKHADVKPGPIGTTGYCMGGRMSLVAAGTYPDRIAAAAAYHPGGLVTDAPDSPHLIASKAKARIYVGGASEDANFTDEHRAKLDETLANAGVDRLVEKYPAKHGWVPSDTPVHDPAQAERHWQTLLALFEARLR